MSIRSDDERDEAFRGPAGRELDLGGIGRALKRRKGWMIGPALLCCAMAIGYVSLVQPRYTADSKVIIENGESYFTRPDKTDLQQQVLPDDEAVQSQVQLISSRDIAREAIRRLDLKGNPEFDPLAKGLDPVSRLLILFGLQRDPTSVAPEDRILQAYYDRLMVFPLVKTRVITIEFTATDPDLAARAANTIAELYIEAQSAAKRDSARSASDSLGTLVSDLRARSAEADAKADAYRSSNGLLVGTNNNTITSQQLADISTQLAQSRTAEADAQAKAKLIREMIRQGRIGEVPDVANNELIRRISEQRVTLRAELAQQGRTLLPGHPRMQELNAQLQDVDNQLRSAAEKAVRTLENDAHIATSRVENLSAALDEQKKTASTAGADQVKLNTLELQSRLLKEQLEFNTGKYQEALARMAATSTPADARVISRADPPQLPSFPKKLPIILIATLAGLILSVGMLVSSELLSGRAFAGEEQDEPVVVLPQDLGLKPSLTERLATATPSPIRQPVDEAPPLVRVEPSVAEPDAIPEPAPPVLLVEPGQRGMPVEPGMPTEPAIPEDVVSVDSTEPEEPHVPFEPTLPAAGAPRFDDTEELIAALDALRTATAEGGATRVLMTSAVRRRYVGPASLHLARSLARRARTILVDFDRQMPAVLAPNTSTVTVSPGTGDVPGLSELVSGEATFAEIIHRDSRSRLHVVPVGNADLPEDDDASYRLVLEALAETYDYVVLHAPIIEDALTRTLVQDTDALVFVTDEMDAADLLSVRSKVETWSAKPVYVAEASMLIAGSRDRSAA